MDNNQQTTGRKKPLAFLVYLHDDLSDHDKKALYKDYFGWFITELKEVSGREVLVLFPERVRGVSDHEYQHKNEWKSLDTLADAIDTEIIKKTENYRNYDPNLHKFLLLTRFDIKSNVAGVAYPGGRVGIASIKSYRSAAHEIGHMLTATHEDSSVSYNGWWNDSIMSVDIVGSAFRGNDYRYSDKNRDNIRNYLDQFE